MFSNKTFFATVASAFVLSTNAWAQTSPAPDANYEPVVGQPGKDVIWVPTAQTLVDRMLDMAELKPEDRLVDLGSGDGRTVITAAKRGATAHGIEYNPKMVELSRQAAKAEGVADSATFEQADIFKSDFSNATVITLFLLPELNLRLRPTLLDMKPGTRVVSNTFHMGDWQPDETAQIAGCSTHCTAFKWVIPAKAGGTWKIADKELMLTQTFQMLEGTLREGNTTLPISDARLNGTQIQFSVGDDHYFGVVNGNEMRGTINNKTAWSATFSKR